MPISITTFLGPILSLQISWSKLCASLVLHGALDNWSELEAGSDVVDVGLEMLWNVVSDEVSFN